MREKPHKLGLVTEPGTDDETWPTASKERNLEGAGKPKWYEKLPYDDFVQDLPMLRYVRGSKSKISITTFQEINDVCQSIFEKNKSSFRFRVQVDLLAHYIGTKILEHIYIVRVGGKKNPLSQLLEDQEGQFIIWDQMKNVKEIFKTLCEKKVDGFITEEEFQGHIDRYIDTFDATEDRIKMSRIIDFLIENGADKKAKERVRKNYENRQRAKEKGIVGVK